ncbi:MAG: response regulator [Pseudomonadota bacterium]
MSAILVVDDDPQVLELLSQMLLLEGHTVTRARNGIEAEQAYEDTEFDLVITDLIMPEREGIETIARMRQRTKVMPIIAISGGGRIGPGDYLQTAAQMGANATLAKPFNRHDLVTIVTELLGTRGAPLSGLC